LDVSSVVYAFAGCNSFSAAALRSGAGLEVSFFATVLEAQFMPATIEMPEEDLQRIRDILKQINLSAKRLQRSTAIEAALLQLRERFYSVVEDVKAVKRQGGPKDVGLDREWKNCLQIEISQLRGFLLEAAARIDFEPVAIKELTALVETAKNLGPLLDGPNWGTADTQCDLLLDNIEYGLLECRRVTRDTILFLSSISEPLAVQGAHGK
jgi:hypothetical protein